MTHAERAKRRAEMCRRVQAGESIKQVAAAFGVCVCTVRLGIKEAADPSVRARSQVYRPPSWAKALDWSRTDAELARLAGVTRERVRVVRKNLGLTPSKGRLPPPRKAPSKKTIRRIENDEAYRRLTSGAPCSPAEAFARYGKYSPSLDAFARAMRGRGYVFLSRRLAEWRLD